MHTGIYIVGNSYSWLCWCEENFASFVKDGKTLVKMHQEHNAIL